MMRGLAVILSRVAPGYFLHPDDPRGDAQWQGASAGISPTAVTAMKAVRSQVTFEVEICGRTDVAVHLRALGTSRPRAWVSLAEVTLAPVMTEQGYLKREPRFVPGEILTPWYEVHAVTMPVELARQIRWW